MSDNFVYIGKDFNPKPIQHGRLSAYKVRGCRCELCRAANRDYTRKYLGRRGVTNKPTLTELQTAIDAEKRRIIGIVLAEYSVLKLSGEERIAKVIDALATKIEHSESSDVGEEG